MKRSNLSHSERKLLASYRADEWKSVKKFGEQKEHYRAYARATFSKDKRVNIRIASKDLIGLQKRAMREGIPYQTLIASILHKYANGILVER